MGVEGADGEGEFVERVEVGGVLGADEGAEEFFLGGSVGEEGGGLLVEGWRDLV